MSLSANYTQHIYSLQIYLHPVTYRNSNGISYKKKDFRSLESLCINVHDAIRTRDLPLRRRTLYPTELRKQILKYYNLFHNNRVRFYPNPNLILHIIVFRLFYKIYPALHPYDSFESSFYCRFSDKIFFIYTNIKNQAVTINSYNINQLFCQTINFSMIINYLS